MRLLRSLRLAAVVLACLAWAATASAQVENPIQVQFTCSPDQATLTRYEVRAIVESSGSATAVVSAGLPTPIGGLCTVAISTAGWESGIEYRIQVRSVRGAAVSAWVSTARTGVVTTEPPTGTVYYVSATVGLDTNPGTTTQPFRTITKAYSVATAGVTIIVRAGTYTDYSNGTGLLFNKSGTAGQPITIRSEVKWGAVLDGQNLGTSRPQVIYLSGNYHIIDGFEITRGFNVPIGVYGQNNQIRNNHVHDNGHLYTDVFGGGSIFSDKGSGGTIYWANYIHDNGRALGTSRAEEDHGFYLCGDNEVVANNIVADHSGFGLQVAGYQTVSNMRVYNNVFVGNKSGMMIWQPVSGVDIKNNIFANNRRYAIETYNAHGSGVVIDRNDAYQNPAGTYALNIAGSDFTYTMGTNYTANPLFVSASDFHLQVGSGLIDLGLPLAVVSADFAATSRPQGGGYDIGAYER